MSALMRKYNSPNTSVLWFLVKLVIFCSLWLLCSSHPFMQNLFYAIALFLGSEFLTYSSFGSDASTRNHSSQVPDKTR